MSARQTLWLLVGASFLMFGSFAVLAARLVLTMRLAEQQQAKLARAPQAHVGRRRCRLAA